MSNISEKDLQTFFEVLKKLQKIYESDKSSFMYLIGRNLTGDQKKLDNSSIVNNEAIKTINLFDMAKSKTKEEMIQELMQFNTKELKFLQKKFNLGGSNIKAQKSIVEYIVDQMQKRSVDVFRDQA